MTSASQWYRAQTGGTLGGEIEVPGDKSISHRALLLGAIAEGSTEIHGLLRGEDCLATLAALRLLGVAIADEPTRILVQGVGLRGLRAPPQPLDLGNSGTAMRLFCGLLAGQDFVAELTGDASLRRRPMERVAAPLRSMGADIATREGCAPIRVRGVRNLNGIDYALPVASAQIKSALLLAGLQAHGRTTIRSPAVTRDHTERMLTAMGAHVEIGPDYVSVRGPAALHAITLDVPGDFSSAAFFMVAGCLAAERGMVIRNVGINPTRIGLLSVLEQMGGRIGLRNLRSSGAEPVADIHVVRGPLHGVEVAPELIPLLIDELPILFIAAAAAQGTTRVSGAEELRYKESDRLAVMAAGLRRVGVAVEERRDGLIIKGGAIEGGLIDSQGDHRIAMSFAVAALVAKSAITISDTALVATSFPGFVSTAKQVGMQIEVRSAP
jgi:3-phosphoshikimate 1-carboxyvinyltransferase